MHTYMHKTIIFSAVILFILSWSRFVHQSLPSRNQEHNTLPENPILNNTLGFQAVYALALPDRKDRVQPLLTAANATNITVTVLDAVRDSQIPKDDWPKGWAENREPKVGELGCLISHVRTWKKMVQERVQTALIMESDSDWDMRIKEIMAGLGIGTKVLVDWPFNITQETTGVIPDTISPYGDKWDIIWVGHCGSSNSGEGRIYRFNDSTVPPEDKEYSFAAIPGGDQHVPGTRMVYALGGSVCSTAYAISYQGAVKLVEYFKYTGDNIDLALGWLCDNKVDLACVGVFPQVVTAAASHSNIKHPDGEVAQHEDDEAKIHPGPGLQYSARVNAQKAMQGLGIEDWEAEWDSTWVMKEDKWTLVSFEEAKIIKEVDSMEQMNGTTATR